MKIMMEPNAISLRESGEAFREKGRRRNLATRKGSEDNVTRLSGEGEAEGIGTRQNGSQENEGRL